MSQRHKELLIVAVFGAAGGMTVSAFVIVLRHWLGM